jgi:hypothetical protein
MLKKGIWMIIGSALLVTLMGLSGCKSDGNGLESVTGAISSTSPVDGTVVVPAPLGQSPGRANVYSVGLKLNPAKTVYLPGEPIEMNITVLNASQGEVDPVTVDPCPPAINIMSPGGTPDSDKLVKTFAAGNEQKTLAKGEQIIYPITWDQKDDNGNQIPAGWYFYGYTCFFGNQSIPGGKVGSGGTERAFLVQYSQGALQKTIELNQSQTITDFPFDTLDGKTQPIDLTLTLKQVEMSENGISFMMVASSPDNPVPGYNNPEWMSGFREAQYVVDGVVKEARAANTSFLDSGIELRWGYNDAYLDPVPVDAKQLTIIITKFGSWQGRLEFQVPL